MSYQSSDDLEVSIVMPCLNEAASLASCIRSARAYLDDARVRGEIIVADNGSDDGSPDIARQLGASVVLVDRRGYGEALRAGIAAARGKYIIMGDADGTYDFRAVGPFVERMRGGVDLVIGNRFEGGITQGAMPVLNRYIGNPVLSGLAKLFFRTTCRDFHCGLRAVRREVVEVMCLRSSGMEFASEMIIQAVVNRLTISEVPTTLEPRAPGSASHLRAWKDGWRHLCLICSCAARQAIRSRRT